MLGEPPERFVPEQMGGTLLAAEHLVRYWWAAQAAPGADVLDAACGVGFGTELLLQAGARSAVGVDLSAEAVTAARERCAEAASFYSADVQELPLEADSVDLAVCFETIEHVERPERAIAELRRVLRPTGALLISSPNRGVSPPDNPYHVREYTTEELEAELAEVFRHVEIIGQQSWFASILSGPDDRGGDPSRELELGVRSDQAVAPGEETYAVAVASEQPVAALRRGGAFLSSPGGPDALHEELRKAQRQAHLECERAERAEAQARRLATELEAARWATEAMESSPSWRITAPLRSAKRLLSTPRR